MSKIDIIRGGKYMKSTGVVRRVDELGRIVIPIELRR
ncbi:transition state regulatory protein AbrB, partial [Clostridium botulinum NCTC 2916]